MKFFSVIAVLIISLTACTQKAVDAVPISGFNTERFLGTWYEVARLDHFFERGLTNVTAEYSRRADGSINVLNQGYNEKDGKFERAKGKAKFAGGKATGQLKVSFFGPFYGDYIIFDLDKRDYSYAYISGGNDNYLWLLSRSPSVSIAVREDFIRKSKALGYDTDALIWVDQSRAR